MTKRDEIAAKKGQLTENGYRFTITTNMSHEVLMSLGPSPIYVLTTQEARMLAEFLHVAIAEANSWE